MEYVIDILVPIDSLFAVKEFCNLQQNVPWKSQIWIH